MNMNIHIDRATADIIKVSAYLWEGQKIVERATVYEDVNVVARALVYSSIGAFISLIKRISPALAIAVFIDTDVEDEFGVTKIAEINDALEALIGQSLNTTY